MPPAFVMNCVRGFSISLDFAAMVHYYCKNSSAANDFSFHGFPKDEKLVKVRNVFMFFCRRVERYLGTFSFNCVAFAQFAPSLLFLGLDYAKKKEILKKILR